MFVLITVLIVIAAIVLILVVLVQNSKGGGLSSSFSSSNNVMGVRKTTDFIEKATWYLAGAVIVLSLISAKFISNNPSSATNTAPVPVAPAAPAQQAPNVGSNLPLPTADQPATAAPAATEEAPKN
ncbi:preprotein translocase subunit SecG [Dysgonomonas sp. PH5-45]|uniref:preprotein translocase subunit SecG n=1 Tax=unclassified Dysgonomonas TaxID=2630389 RepID=UPI002476E2BC|nr:MULTISPECIES: preprotein translocase subunit SecG [unclassified Dysgonomonas]MDH6354427.1 preprotein translocase subunit SecG [Dysgonomonas sp. PH5-45]MDH6387326.1 preprotein translocase subunit SecG [Dysgonomonas sp. PH5-37]